MNLQEIEGIAEVDNVSLQIEKLKVMLITSATTNDFVDSKEYRRVRKFVVNIPGIVIPHFLSICRTPEEFWAWISSQDETDAERRLIIANGLNPILDFVEHYSKEGTFDFVQNYEKKRMIGEGGFGQVFLYEHKSLKLPFAVKVFAPSFYNGGGNEIERFFQEAKMLFSLQHKSIIKIYDAGMFGSRPFIRMEFFDGKSLNEILRERGRLSPEQALILMKNITSGIQHAHEVGIIHRDLKPSNIMASKPAQFRIIDFGLGIFIENKLHSRFTKTGEGAISGLFTAPELISNPKLIDQRSDIYSLGAIWYATLFGQPPAGTSTEKSLGELNVDKNYRDCIVNCLKNIEDRTSSCEVLLSELESL